MQQLRIQIAYQWSYFQLQIRQNIQIDYRPACKKWKLPETSHFYCYFATGVYARCRGRTFLSLCCQCGSEYQWLTFWKWNCQEGASQKLFLQISRPCQQTLLKFGVKVSGRYPKVLEGEGEPNWTALWNMKKWSFLKWMMISKEG